MTGIDALASQLQRTIEEKDKNKITGYDTQAEVTRVSDDTIWVKIPGGTDETPVGKTVSCKEGDSVQIRVSDHRAWITGNYTAPATDDTKAIEAAGIAEVAEVSANNAIRDAAIAQDAADFAMARADDANTAASSAIASAKSAQVSADSALVSLSTVEDVVGVLNWITEHGTMTANGNTDLDPSKVYFIRDNNGDYHVGSYYYSIVSEPKAEDRTSYYTLSIDESVQNYVATHIVVDTEGLWIIPDSGGNKVLIATGSGSTYTTAGTYIIGKVNSVDTILADFTSSRAQIGSGDSGNLLAASNGIVIRDGPTELATFGASAIQIGQTDDTRLTLTTSGLSIDGYGVQDTPMQFMFLGNNELQANGEFNINLGHGVSSKTDTYLTTDKVHMDFAHTSLEFDGSANAINEPVHIKTESYDNGIQIDSDLIANKSLTSNGHIYLAKSKAIFGTDTDGNYQTVLDAWNSSDNTSLGYGHYSNSKGDLNLYGNGITLTSRGNINANQPLKVGSYKIITTQTFNADNISIAANGYAEGNISITKTGYTAIGVLDTYVNNASSSGSGSSFAAIYRTYHSGNTYYYGLRNVTNAAIKVRIYAKILYVANAQGI